MWRKQYERMLRQQERIDARSHIVREYAIGYTKPNKYYVDDVISCLLHIHHLKDWLISCKHITSDEANSFLTENPELLVCQSVANGNKHLTTEFRERKSDVFHEVVDVKQKAKGELSDKEYVQVVLIDGDKYDAKDLIEKSINIWKVKLGQLNLLK